MWLFPLNVSYPTSLLIKGANECSNFSTTAAWCILNSMLAKPLSRLSSKSTEQNLQDGTTDSTSSQPFLLSSVVKGDTRKCRSGMMAA